ncbi:MAG: hypothetical protein AB7K09_20020 [Planctomycetota bacterium]
MAPSHAPDPRYVKRNFNRFRTSLAPSPNVPLGWGCTTGLALFLLFVALAYTPRDANTPSSPPHGERPTLSPLRATLLAAGVLLAVGGTLVAAALSKSPVWDHSRLAWIGVIDARPATDRPDAWMVNGVLSPRARQQRDAAWMQDAAERLASMPVAQRRNAMERDGLSRAMLVIPADALPPGWGHDGITALPVLLMRKPRPGEPAHIGKLVVKLVVPGFVDPEAFKRPTYNVSGIEPVPAAYWNDELGAKARLHDAR